MLEQDPNRPQSHLRRNFLKTMAGMAGYSLAGIEGRATILETAQPLFKIPPSRIDEWYPRNLCNGLKTRDLQAGRFLKILEEDAGLLNRTNIHRVMPGGLATYKAEAFDIARQMSLQVAQHTRQAFEFGYIPEGLAQDPAFKGMCQGLIECSKNEGWQHKFRSERQIMAEVRKLYENPESFADQLMEAAKPIFERMQRFIEKAEAETRIIGGAATKVNFYANSILHVKAKPSSVSEGWRKKIAVKSALYTLEVLGYEAKRGYVEQHRAPLWLEQIWWQNTREAEKPREDTTQTRTSGFFSAR